MPLYEPDTTPEEEKPPKWEKFLDDLETWFDEIGPHQRVFAVLAVILTPIIVIVFIFIANWVVGLIVVGSLVVLGFLISIYVSLYRSINS